MNKDQKECLVNKLKSLRAKVLRAKRFTKKNDWKDFRVNINKEKTK